jgi:hypothetical protein
MAFREIFAIIAIAAGWATSFSSEGQVHNIALALLVIFTIIYFAALIIKIYHPRPKTVA